MKGLNIYFGYIYANIIFKYIHFKYSPEIRNKIIILKICFTNENVIYNMNSCLSFLKIEIDKHMN